MQEQIAKNEAAEGPLGRGGEDKKCTGLTSSATHLISFYLHKL